MTIYQSIGQAWATLFGFEKEGNEILFNGKPTYYYNNPITDWETLLDAKPSEIKSVAQVAETPSTRTYAELMQPENFSYSAFNWTNEHGTRVGFSLGSLIIYNTDDFDLYLQGYQTGVGVIGNSGLGAYDNSGLGYPDFYDDTYVSIYIYANTDETIFVDVDDMTSETGGPVNFGFYWYQNSEDAVFAILVTENGLKKYTHTAQDGWSNINTLPYFEQSLELYFDDGAHLPEGVEWDETLESYFVPTIADVSTAELVTSQASLAMQGATIMTHCTLWAGGVTMMVFIYSIFAFIKHCFARR